MVVVDVKTGKTPVSKDDAQRHAQLALYQLAVAEGLLPHGDEPGGARLVYLGRSGLRAGRTRAGSADAGSRDEWRQLVGRPPRQWPAAVHRPVNDGCPHCPMRPGCPAHAGGPR
ncbi:PD-(D/E)XK nuclease superfamily protein [Mycobacterium xenopi 4042]|uniref:PD-(D/E)XK nuclease superfamily protein n=1 Tax=Mycobacterium xenopi 4042 TaxID=1299334 RepID=X7YIL2_MYCXE|nr:PD-(D/E)XK nuclease superfamily protein [Mycobacterium xenopi 4042]